MVHNQGAPIDLPYKTKVSFRSLIEYWKNLASHEDSSQATRARAVLQRLEKAPELLVPFDDLEILEKYQEEAMLMTAPLFPESLQDNEIKAITIPFSQLFFRETRRMSRILENGGYEITGAIEELGPDEVYKMASIFVLNAYYDAGIQVNRPMHATVPDNKTGITRKYRVFINADFMEIKKNPDTGELTEEEICRLVDEFDNIELWRELMPPGGYQFEGFVLISLFDVTVDYALTSIKQTLLEDNTLQDLEQQQKVEIQLQAYFNTPDIELGLGLVDMNSSKVMPITRKGWMCPSEMEGIKLPSDECFCDNSYGQLFKDGRTVVISNVERAEHSSALIKRMESGGIGSFLVHPIISDDRFKGFIEITSRKPKVVNRTIVAKLEELIPVFQVAFERGVEQFRGEVESLIQEEYTALHPSVSWKFYDAAEAMIRNRIEGKPDPGEDVVFENVVPLYGQFDVRGSSAARNASIQHDLVRQLMEAEKVFDSTNGAGQLPLYDHLKFRIQKWRRDLESGIGAGDEVKILDLLKTEIYPVFSHLEKQSPLMKDAVDRYKKQLDPELMVIYEERKKYEDSITVINDTVQDVIEEHQVKAQEMYPHYFEKYKTDGIEYNLYIGQSIAPRKLYDSLYLKNLRLWQIFLAHAVEMKLNALQPELPMRLETVALVLAHDAPLAIKFRMDEMKFDVDGAYNVRYEIMKKRIDKAYIRGTSERITQPGMLTVVYSTDEEAAEYEKYFEYLTSLDLFEGELEHHVLEDLQGLSGLRAMRMRFNYDYNPDKLIEAEVSASGEILDSE